MRSAEFGVIKDRFFEVDKKISLKIYQNMCRSRYFDLGVIKATESNRIKYMVYLSLGQEAIPATLAVILEGYYIFTQHRCHAYYITFGGKPEMLRDELLGLSTGTSGGRAGSNCIQCHHNGVHMFGHHGLIGENVPIAVGSALGSNNKVLCVFGDGAAEEDYIYPSLGFSLTHKLPILFVCEDNNLSILTPVSVRRNWKITDLAKGMGLPAVDVTDDPWTIYSAVKELQNNLPALINIYTCRMHWHVGIGTDGLPEWDRFQITEQTLELLGLSKEMDEIKKQAKEEMEQLWKNQL